MHLKGTSMFSQDQHQVSCILSTEDLVAFSMIIEQNENHGKGGIFFWQIVPLSINVLKFISNMTFTACTIENSIDYHGNGVGVGTQVPDAHACQAYCKLNNHPFFVWLHNDHQTDPEMCFCKSSDSGRTSNAKSTAGVAQGCGGSKYREHVHMMSTKMVYHPSHLSDSDTDLYRVAHLLADLGWVDLDLGYFTTLLGQQIAAVAAHQPGNFSHLSPLNLGL